jgi:hypothetical protein
VNIKKTAACLLIATCMLTATGVAAAETSSSQSSVVNGSVNKDTHVLTTAVPLMATGTSAAAVRSRTTPPIGTQLAELEGFDTVAGDGFGDSVAISDTTAVVGASGHAGGSGAGAAYVLTKTAGVWKQTAELKGSDIVSLDDFGCSVAISDTTAVVGANLHANDAGRAYVFTKTTGVWKQTAELAGSDTVADDQFGSFVAISGRTAIVGAPAHRNYAGRAYVFTETGAGWKQVAELTGSDTVADDIFGDSVAILGTTVVVGAGGHAKNAGRAYVFTKAAGVWKQTAELAGSDTVAQDAFGSDVAFSPSAVVVGAEGHAKNAGRVYVLTKAAGVWKQTAELAGSDTAAGDWFGVSVGISGTTAVVGAYRTANKAGAAYVFTKTAGVWKQTAELKGSAGDWLGNSVAISGTTAVVGAFFASAKAGRAYVFKA